MPVQYSFSRSQVFTFASLSFLLLLLNIGLLIQNRQLSAAQATAESNITVGTQILPIRITDEDGERKEMLPSGAKALVLVYSNTCQFCEKNTPNWRTIVSAAKANKLQIVGIGLGRNANAYLDRHGLTALNSTISLNKVRGGEVPQFDVTPQTILLDSDGRVEQVWSGVLSSERVVEVMNTLSKL